MGNCCFCCLDEDAKVGKVLENFPPVPVSAAQNQGLQKVVGVAVAAGNQPFYTPGANTPCVYFQTKVFEEWERITQREDPQTHRRTWHRSRSWRQIVCVERFIDFYLQDGKHKIFVQASDRKQIKVQGTRDGGRSSNFTTAPWGIERLISENCSGWGGWGRSHGWHDGFNQVGEFKTGNYKYEEKAFDIGEKVAALGVVQTTGPDGAPFKDPYNGNPISVLRPFSNTTLDEKYFEENNWESHAKDAWQELLKTPAVLLSDNTTFTGTVTVSPPDNMPAWVSQPFNQQAMNSSMYSNSYQPAYAGGPAPSGPAPQAQTMQMGGQPQQNYGATQQGGYPPQQQGGYPPQQQGGYPPQQQGGYPPQQQGGYPPQQQGGYPPQQQGGYPPQQQGGYPPQQQGY